MLSKITVSRSRVQTENRPRRRKEGLNEGGNSFSEEKKKARDGTAATGGTARSLKVPLEASSGRRGDVQETSWYSVEQ